MAKKAAGNKPLILMTGAAGKLGTALTRALKNEYHIVGLDVAPTEETDDSYRFDLTSAQSVRGTLNNIAGKYGRDVAAVIHLAAYFDFSGEESPLYQAVNVEGTRNLLDSLRGFNVERFIYSSTMLVHRPGVPGEKINEDTPIEPTWIYPRSKAETEETIREHAGDMPYTLLRLAGLYDDSTSVPLLSHQIARIYEHSLKSHMYAASTDVGQAFVHQDDMIDAFRRTVARRSQLPKENEILIGEEHSESYQSIQNRVGELIHGKRAWKTLQVPGPVAKAGAWAEEHAEPIIPDDFDQGEKPFIRPFMVDRAGDHYELDISRAREQLGWSPRHAIYDKLGTIVDNLKADPHGWYEANGITPPHWMAEAEEQGADPHELVSRHEDTYRKQHGQTLWARLLVIVLGAWLLASPPALDYSASSMLYSDLFSGLLLIALGCVSLSWRQGWARWACALVGVWLLFAPLVFWTESAAAYLNDTIVGMLAIGLAVLVRPTPGISPSAAVPGPVTPPGWDNNPSSWMQRMPIIVLALIGFFIARYLAAYQLGHIEGVWEPLFSGTRSGLNGTEDIITSEVSEAWPIPDAGLGSVVYALEALVGLAGATHRWRSMPWVVALFGVMIVPLGVVSITFIIIQPIMIGTWCTLCLTMAAAMLLQIAYAFNELVATGQFLRRRHRAGAPVLKIFFVGDADDGASETAEEEFGRSPLAIMRDAFGTGVNLPWNLALCILIGLWLMSTRLILDSSGGMADWDHLVGALIITVATISLAGAARPARLLMIPLGAILFFTPFIYGSGLPALLASLLCGAAVIALSLRRGPIPGSYGSWDKLLI